jgi:cytidylate kinase
MRLLSSIVPSSFIDRHLGESGADFDEKRYVEFLSRIILDLAAEDNVVILGRGSQFILRHDPKALRVLLVAERADRIKFMERTYNMPPDKAEAMVNRESRKRERFLGNFYKGNPNDPSLYHMVLNTSLIHLEAAEEQITELVLGAVDATAEPIWD